MTKDGLRRSEFSDEDANRIEHLLQSALPRVGDQAEPDRDLWPDVLRRIDRQSSPGFRSVPWIDWALGAGLLAFAAMVPRTIPVILYYL